MTLRWSSIESPLPAGEGWVGGARISVDGTGAPSPLTPTLSRRERETTA